jgi:hypothetical protein
VAKDDWEILKTAHEGTTKVKSAKLQLLTTKFENLKMLEDECIQDYHLNILDIVNDFDSLGEKISDEKLVRKILRSVPKRFDMKVTAIEEAQDISSMKVDELVGSLQAFELANGYKKKNIAFVSDTDEEDVQCDMDIDESILDAFVRFGREFNKVLEMIDKKSRPNVQNIPSNISRNSESQRRDRNDVEYSNYVTALVGRCKSDEESDDEEATYEELLESFKNLYAKSVEVIKEGDEQKRIIAQLQTEKNKLVSTKSDLQNEVTLLSSKLEKQKKTINDFCLEKDKLMSIITGLQEENTLLNSKLENMTKCSNVEQKF